MNLKQKIKNLVEEKKPNDTLLQEVSKIENFSIFFLLFTQDIVILAFYFKNKPPFIEITKT